MHSRGIVSLQRWNFFLFLKSHKNLLWRQLEKAESTWSLSCTFAWKPAVFQWLELDRIECSGKWLFDWLGSHNMKSWQRALCRIRNQLFCISLYSPPVEYWFERCSYYMLKLLTFPKTIAELQIIIRSLWNAISNWWNRKNGHQK